MMKRIILNPQQRQAVKHQKGPLLIVAGAGTGKTTVITEHIKYLIQKKKLSPQNILAATFTDKAATEMLERLDVVMPLGYEEPWLGTFHSLCERILRSDGLEIGIDTSYKIITPPEQWILIKKYLFEFKLKYYRPLGNPTKFITAILKYFSRAQDEDIDPETLIKYSEMLRKKAKDSADKEYSEKMFELSKAYQEYQVIKNKESMLDFSDLISQTILLFRKRISILKKYQDQFQHVLVDEFQDTNFAQYQLIKLLCPLSQQPNLVVTGDDDQSIYKFRGAAISNILNFKKDYPRAKQVVLIKNYRSLKPILKSAYHLIQNNNPYRLETKLKIGKKLTPARKEIFVKPQIVNTQTEEGEVNFTINKIMELVARRNYSYKDFAILARANSYLDPFVAGLKRHGLPYQLIGNRGLFDQEEVRDLIHFLRIVVKPTDSASLFHFLHLKKFGLSAEEVFDHVNQATKQSKDLWQVLKEQKSKKISDIVSLIKEFQSQSLTTPISRLLHSFLYRMGYIQELTRLETVENLLKIKNINLFFDLIARFEADNKQISLINFIDLLDIWQEAGENPAQAVIEDIDTINLLTVHSAKGLEFPVVFVTNLVAGRFPAINRKDPIEFPEQLIKETLSKGNESIQEERRLFYVAMTRARDYLYLTYSTDYGGMRERKPSGFLYETKILEKKVNVELTQLSLSPVKPASPLVRYLDKKRTFGIKYLSYSQIDTFLACPLKYKYRYILKVPAEPHHSLSFGQTIHNTLYDFHRMEKQGKTPSVKELLTIYKRNFIELGYESEKHKKHRFQAGKKALRNYHRVFSDFFGKPVILERTFRLQIAGIPLIGKIDRIDRREDGFEIIDYKTGETKDQKSVDKDRQLSIYGLAAKESLGKEISTMSLYFIEANLKITTTRNQDDYEREKEYITEIATKIKQSDFPAKPGYPFPCKFCEYNRICPFAAKK